MKYIIKQKIDLIAEHLLIKIQKAEKASFGLYSGESGILLFLFYYSKYSQNEKYALLTENYAEELLYQFAGRVNSHTFCSGLSGMLYLFEFLRENHFIDIDVSNIQPSLDNYLVFRMRQDIQKRYYDFMHGALGVGLYFIKKRTYPEYIHELTDYLYHTAEKDTDNHIFKWESVINPEKNNTVYNLALCHGISSIIIFLSRVINSDMSNERNCEMLVGAVNYLLSQQKNFSQFGSCFPSFILKEFPENISKSRLAWCYGDLGVGIALWQAGKVLKKMEWQEKGLEILLQSTRRQQYSETFVDEAGICHGSTGIVLIYRRMFFETHYNEFKEAVLYWLNRTLKFSNYEDGLAGYKTLVKNKWICDYSLLTGIAGIGLVLLSYLENDLQNWDEMMLLS